MRGLLCLFLVLISLGAKAGEVPPSEQMCLNKVARVQGGDGTPWPWGNEVRFPWSQIEGVWAPVTGDCNSRFVFKVGSSNESGERFIQVIQYDPVRCEKSASGVGFESNRVIYASMTGVLGAFDLTIRAFDPSTVKDRRIGLQDTYDAEKAVVVLTMFPKNQWDKRTSYKMERLNANTALLCD